MEKFYWDMPVDDNCFSDLGGSYGPERVAFYRDI